MFEYGRQFPDHFGVTLALTEIPLHLHKGGDVGGAIHQPINKPAVLLPDLRLKIPLNIEVIVVLVGCVGGLQLGLLEVSLPIGLHQLHEEAVVLAVDVAGLPRLDVQLVEGDLLVVLALRVLVVARGYGGGSLDLLHLLEMQLEGALLHVYVGEFALALGVEHKQ
jgi:hypothetical protein